MPAFRSLSAPYRLRAARLIAICLTALSGAAWGASMPPAGVVTELDRVLVVVNDDVITATQLSMRLSETRKQLAHDKIAAPPDAVLQKQLLERMVLERIQVQTAERAGLRVSDADIERAYASIAKQNQISVDQLRERMRQEALDPDIHRQNVRQQLLIDQLIDREVRNRVSVTEAEIEVFLDNREALAAMNTEYNLSHIFLPVPESASPESIQAVKRKGEELLAGLRQGGSFEQTAIAHSQGADALKGGQLGWRKSGQLPEMFVAALKTMRQGDVSELLRSPNGFHILKLNDRRGDAPAEAVQQTRARHILIRPSEILSRDDARAKLLQLRARIEQGEDFANLARAHSEDTGSANRGGDLGWAAPGQFVPEFEKTMNALKPGELSQPVQSAFGLHLIQVMERRTQDVTEERLRTQARNQLHARKAEERYQQWLRQMRDEAFVQYSVVEESN
jgi:peptidyl-prolyl cis-trans isomerase SurA